MANKNSLIVLVCFFFTTTAFSQYEKKIEAAKALFEKFAKENNVPGASISVSVRGEIIWSYGWGFADLEQHVPVDPSKTLFRIGSVSKPITAFALGRLVDQGKIDLDVPIQQYVPLFPVKKYPITLRQLAGHLAGIRHYKGNEMENKEYFPNVEEGLSFFINDSLLFVPGTKYFYSSYGWNLISMAIENVVKRPFLDYIQDEVFDLIGLGNTYADQNKKIIPYRARFYEKTKVDSMIIISNATYVDNSYKWAGGGFISTTEDLLRFAQAHTGNWFLSSNILNQWLVSQQTIDGKETGYGLGWATGTYNGEKWFGHSGGAVGGVTQLVVFPEKGVSVAILTNVDPVQYDLIHRQIASIFFPKTISIK